MLSRPDAPQGRSKKLVPSEISAYALEAGLNLLRPVSLRPAEVADQIRELAPDLGIVVAYGALIPPEILSIPRYGWINVHFSALPRWRGAAPVQRALMAGDEDIAIDIFQLEAGLDTGPIWAEERFEIRPEHHAGSLLAELAAAAPALLDRALQAIVNGENPRPQSGEVTLAPMLKVPEGQIDWRLSQREIAGKLRGFYPNPGAWTLDPQGRRLKVGPPTPPANPLPSDMPALAPGQLYATKKALWVGTGDQPLQLGTVAPAGKQHMEAAAWARGARLEAGAKFGWSEQ